MRKKRTVLLVHDEHLIYVLATVAQARNLVLATQLALALEPLVEESRLCLDHLQVLQGDIVESLRGSA